MYDTYAICAIGVATIKHCDNSRRSRKEPRGMQIKERSSLYGFMKQWELVHD